MKHKLFFPTILSIAILITSLSCLEGSIGSILDEIAQFANDFELDINKDEKRINVQPPNVKDDKYKPYFEEENIDTASIVIEEINYVMHYLIVEDADNKDVPTPEEVKSKGQVLIDPVNEPGPEEMFYFDIEPITKPELFPPGTTYYVTIETVFPDGMNFLSPVERIDSF